MPPKLTVCIVTYQHAAYIKQAIEGALDQQAEFSFEVLIGEDGSTDGTREICLDYAQRHPDRIRVALRDRSDVMPSGISGYIARNTVMTLREARGEFIAFCEGDDYWTDPTKLQRQVDYLLANPDCVGCFHDTKLVDAEGETLLESYFQSEQEKFTHYDVLESLLSREPTCSLVFRRSALTEPLPEWFLSLPCDLYLDILLSNHGSLGFVRRNMGAYRKHAGGIWSGQREVNKIIELILRYKILLINSSFEKNKDLILKKIGDFSSLLFTKNDEKNEIARLTGIVIEQTAFIKILEQERDRLTPLAATQAKDNDHYIKTINKQIAYIKILEQERDQRAHE